MQEDLIIEQVYLKNRPDDGDTVTVKYRIKEAKDIAANYITITKDATVVNGGSLHPLVIIPSGNFVPNVEYLIRVVSNKDKKDFVDEVFVNKWE